MAIGSSKAAADASTANDTAKPGIGSSTDTFERCWELLWSVRTIGLCSARLFARIECDSILRPATEATHCAYARGLRTFARAGDDALGCWRMEGVDGMCLVPIPRSGGHKGRL